MQAELRRIGGVTFRPCMILRQYTQWTKGVVMGDGDGLWECRRILTAAVAYVTGEAPLVIVSPIAILDLESRQ